MKNEFFPLTPTIGTIQDDKIVGREKEITTILKSLRVQSITLEEMRRMGKTLLLRKLMHQCNNDLLPVEFSSDNFKAVYFSFQGKQNLGEVIDTLIGGLEDFKKWYQIDFAKTYELIRKIASSFKFGYGGAEATVNLPEFKQDWKKIFFRTLDDVSESLEKQQQVLILILDELPIMLWDWYKANRYDEAIELLDILRERRQELERKGVRFVYCGSIGIKVILQTLRRKLNYTGEPTNDMLEFNLKPFEIEESKFLMECFILSGFTINKRHKNKILEEIHELCNGLPYYIAQLFLIIQAEFNNEITKDSINNAYKLILNDTTYQKAFNQLKERLEIYYPENAKLMSKILSILSSQEEHIYESSILSQIEDNDDKIKKNLYTLVEDHYLQRILDNGIRKYSFKYKIFRQWWEINIA